MNDKKPLVLIPGSINARVRERIEATFDCLSIERADAALVPDEKKGRIQAIASMTRIDGDFINAFDNLSINA